MTDITPEMITLPSGFQVAIRRHGNPEGPPVFALHGWMDNLASFSELAPLLPELNLVAMDFAGHGHSDHLPSPIDYSLLITPPYVLALADQLGWSRFSIIGHSMGGVCGELIAATYPERVNKLALLDIFGVYTQSAEQMFDRLRSYYDHYFRVVENKRSYSSIEVAASVRQSNGDLNFESARHLVEGCMRSTSEGFKWTFDPRIRVRSAIGLTDEQKEALLQKIQAPVCVVLADCGIFPNLDLMAPSFKQVADCKVHVVPGGHHVHLDEPGVVAPILNDFFG